jgi:hypothetical protein
MTVECVDCDREVYDAALEENNGHCPYCETFLTPPKTVLQEYMAIKCSGVCNMLEWDTVMEVANRHEFHVLIGFLLDETSTTIEQIDAIGRGLENVDVEPAKDPQAIREEHEKVEQEVRNVRTGGV